LTGGLGADTVTGGVGADTFKVELDDYSTNISAIDSIQDFNAVQNDQLQILNEGNVMETSDLRGDGTNYQAVDFKGGNALNANTGFVVNSGTNSSDLTISTIISELQAGMTMNSISTGDNFFYLTDDGTDSRIFLYSDDNNNATLETGEVTAIATLDGLADATQVSATETIDFI
ncbi:MAG: hypothetical protein ACKVJC_06435, partial [Flavobacteriales bacterium]